MDRDQPADQHHEVAVLRALADPVRWAIVRRVAAHEGLTSAELDRSLTLSKSTISHHLRLLTDAGVLVVTRRGRTNVLVADRDVLDDLAARLADLGRPEPPTPPAAHEDDSEEHGELLTW
jgi:ArsR family transcriptional regulator